MRNPGSLVRDAWDAFLLYLPLACLGVLALLTYWMVHTTPGAAAPTAPSIVSHTPDYFMEAFSIKTYDGSGRVRSELMGSHARHFQDTQWLEIDDIRIRSIDEKGHLTTASAHHGLTNEDGSQVQLLGNAVVVRDGTPAKPGEAAERIEYRGEFLHAFMTTERITSHLPVELFRGNDRFSADRLDYDNIGQVLLLEGRVRGTIGGRPGNNSKR